MNLNQIDIKPLEQLIGEYTGYYIKFDVSVKVLRDGSEMLVVVSNELKDYAGIMSSIYETLTLQNFGGGLFTDGSGYWMPIHFAFEYKQGSNGTNLLNAVYSFETNKWRIK